MENDNDRDEGRDKDALPNQAIQATFGDARTRPLRSLIAIDLGK